MTASPPATRRLAALPSRPVIRVLGGVAAFCAVLQLLSATFLVHDYETPNGSTVIARHLAATGELSLPSFHRPVRIAPEDRQQPIRAFHLPGEPALLAAGFRVLPSGLHRYIHVPVTVLFVTAVAAVAFVLFGPRTAAATGAIASLDPFIVYHGPVWDDAVLVAALEWSILAIVTTQLAGMRVARPWVAAVGVMAGYAALTRLQPQFELALIGAALVVVPLWQPARRLGIAALIGISVAICAWGVRNLLVLGTFFLGTSHDGQTLWQHNHARARESILQTGIAQTLAPIDHPASGSEIDVDRAFKRDAIDYLRRHPGDATITASLKVTVSILGIDFGSRSRLRNAIAAASNAVLLVLTALGYRVWRRQFAVDPVAGYLVWCGAIIVGVTLLMLAIGPVGIRYRIAATGFGYLLAALALSAVPWSRWRSRSGRRPAPL